MSPAVYPVSGRTMRNELLGCRRSSRPFFSRRETFSLRPRMSRSIAWHNQSEVGCRIEQPPIRQHGISSTLCALARQHWLLQHDVICRPWGSRR